MRRSRLGRCPGRQRRSPAGTRGSRLGFVAPCAPVLLSYKAHLKTDRNGRNRAKTSGSGETGSSGPDGPWGQEPKPVRVGTANMAPCCTGKCSLLGLGNGNGEHTVGPRVKQFMPGTLVVG